MLLDIILCCILSKTCKCSYKTLLKEIILYIKLITFSGLAVLDGFIYAIGGWDGLSRLNSVERYNPCNNTWEYVAPMKISLTSPAAVGHQGHLYVTGTFF